MKYSENGFFAAQGQSILNDQTNITPEQALDAWHLIQACCPLDAEEIGRMVGVFA